jgi:hypothetical protein
MLVSHETANMLCEDRHAEPVGEPEAHQSSSESTNQPHERQKRPNSVKVEIFSHEYQVLIEPSKRPPTVQLQSITQNSLKVRRLLSICSLLDFHTFLQQVADNQKYARLGELVYCCMKRKNSFITHHLDFFLDCFTRHGSSESSLPSTFHIFKKFVDFIQGYEEAKMKQTPGQFSLH